MHNLMIRDGLGKKRDLGSPQKARDWAARELRIGKANLTFMTTARDGGGYDAWWCRAEDAAYFRGVLESEGLCILHVGRGSDLK